MKSSKRLYFLGQLTFEGMNCSDTHANVRLSNIYKYINLFRNKKLKSGVSNSSVHEGENQLSNLSLRVPFVWDMTQRYWAIGMRRLECKQCLYLLFAQ